MSSKIFQAIENKIDNDIVIIGKGPSIDKIDLSLIGDCIVINVNDSELIHIGDIAVFHHDWVIESIGEDRFKCKLYVTDRTAPEYTSQIHAEYISNNPESSDFLINRFFSDKIYIEHSIVVSALRIANEIALLAGSKKNVYLLGFDFTRKDGYTTKISSAYSHDNPKYQERVISSQERSLEQIMSRKDDLSINIKHVGDKGYSLYSASSFNQIFLQRCSGSIKAGDQFPAKDSSVLNKVKIVAEITTNHFGDMDRLETMVVYAKEAGADFVKFQKRDVESFYSSEQLEAAYESPFGDTFRDYRHGIELNKDQFLFVDSLCKRIGIKWFVSVLDIASYEFMLQFNPNIIKLPSTISEHRGFLEKVAKEYTGDVVISTGYTDETYEKFIISNFTKARSLYLLQCTSSYPTPDKHAHIGIVRHYYNLSKQYSKVIPGYSSHDVGSLCSMMAVAAGARMLEKHVKLGYVPWSHFDEVAVDLENGEFSRFIQDVRDSEEIVGDERKKVHLSEHHKYWH